jgi:hypothetical protein
MKHSKRVPYVRHGKKQILNLHKLLLSIIWIPLQKSLLGQTMYNTAINTILDILSMGLAKKVLKSHPKLKGENCVRQRDINDQADLSYLDEPTSAFDAYTVAIMARTQHFSYA